MRLIPVIMAAGTAMALGACSGSGGMPDMGTTTTTDLAVVPPALTLETPDGGTANISCVGKNTDPAAPAMPTMVSGKLQDFQDSNPVQGATIQLFATIDDLNAKKPLTIDPDPNSTTPTQVISSDGKDPMTGVVDSTKIGNFTYQVPAGYYRVIRVNQNGKAISSGNQVTTIPTYEFNIIYKDTGPTAVKITTKEAIPGLVSVQQMDGLGVLAGGARDCDDVHMDGAIISVSVPGHPEYTGDGLIFYFSDVPGAGTVPVRKQRWTGPNGAFAALNVPPGDGIVTVQGVTTSGGGLTTLSQYKVPVIADAVTIIEAMNGPTTAQ